MYGTCVKSNKAILVGKVPGILRGWHWRGSIARAGEQERSVLISSHVGLSYSVFPTRVSNIFYNQVLNTENNSHLNAECQDTDVFLVLLFSLSTNCTQEEAQDRDVVLCPAARSPALAPIPVAVGWLVYADPTLRPCRPQCSAS